MMDGVTTTLRDVQDLIGRAKSFDMINAKRASFIVIVLLGSRILKELYCMESLSPARPCLQRLVATGNTLATTLCYICAGNIDKTVEIWSKNVTAVNKGEPYFYLLQLLGRRDSVPLYGIEKKKFNKEACRDATFCNHWVGYVIPYVVHLNCVVDINIPSNGSVSVGMCFRMFFETEESSVLEIDSALHYWHRSLGSGSLAQLSLVICQGTREQRRVKAKLKGVLRDKSDVFSRRKTSANPNFQSMLYMAIDEFGKTISTSSEDSLLDDSLVFHIFILNDELPEVPYILEEITDYDSRRPMLWYDGGNTSAAVSFIHENLNKWTCIYP
ncbi:hypothetical protein Tco_0758034 [Tanacetum coccineum]